MTDKRVSYWAQVWMPGHDPRCTKGCEHVLTSIGCDSQAELVAWLRPYSTPAYTFKMIRRESVKDSNSYNDHLLEAEEPMTAERKRANLERLHAIMARKPLPSLAAALEGLTPDDLEPF